MPSPSPNTSTKKKAAIKIQSKVRSLKAIKRSTNFRTIRATNEEKENECVICQEQMKDNEDIIDLECKHKLHNKCLEDILRYGHNNCPLCRREISDNIRSRAALISRRRVLPALIRRRQDLAATMASLENELREAREEHAKMLFNLERARLAKIANERLTHKLTESIKQETELGQQVSSLMEKRNYAQREYDESDKVYVGLDTELSAIGIRIRDLAYRRHTMAIELFDLINQIRQINGQGYIASGKKGKKGIKGRKRTKRTKRTKRRGL